MTDDLQVRTAGQHGHVTVLVCAPNRNVQIGQCPQQARRRLAVTVVPADGNHRQLGVHRGQERRFEIGAAVLTLTTGDHQRLPPADD